MVIFSEKITVLVVSIDIEMFKIFQNARHSISPWLESYNKSKLLILTKQRTSRSIRVQTDEEHYLRSVVR